MLALILSLVLAVSVTVPVSVAPSAAPTSAPSGVATLDGCNMYTAGDYFNNTILSVVANSAAQIASYTAVDTNLTLQIQNTWHVNVTSSPTFYTQHNTSSHATLAGGFPWSSSFVASEPGDYHAAVLVTTNAPNNCAAYGGYWGGSTNINNSTQDITFYAAEKSNLGTNLTNSGLALDMAGGIPTIPGMLVYSDFATKGGWNHALVLVVKDFATCNSFIAPAISSNGRTYSGPAGTDTTNCMPYGAHLRLKSTYSTSGFTAQNLAIATTLKTYGAFLNDAANSALKIPADDDSRWGSTSQLGNITMNSFEVVH